MRFHLILLLQIYTTIFVLFYNFSYNFYNISYYYQNINLLNSKDNLCIILVIFLLILICNKRILKSYTLILISLLVYLNCHFLIETNKLLFSWLFLNTSNLNTNLLNGIMLVHPYILYFFYGLYIYNIFIYTYNCQFLRNRQSYLPYKSLFFSVFLIFIAILLGCWWAEQELAWGGWWSWDFVELLALILLLVLVQNMHKSKLYLFNNYNYTCICIFLLSIFCVRFNIINSVHNFVNIQSQNQFFYYICTFVFITLICLLKNTILKSYNNYNLVFILDNSFNIFLLFLYLYFLKSIFFKNYSYYFFLHFNIRNCICSILLVLLLYFNSKDYKYIHTIFLIITLFLFNGLNYLDYWLIFFLSFFLKNFFKKSYFLKTHHALLILFFFFTLHQVYNFKKDCYTYYDFDLSLIKTSNFTYIECFLKNINSNLNFMSFFFKNNINVCSVINFGDLPFFSYIFEKRIFLLKSLNLLELYNYNLQGLFLLKSSIIWFMFFMSFLFLSAFLLKRFKSVSL
jgi:hypothetical protein